MGCKVEMERKRTEKGWENGISVTFSSDKSKVSKKLGRICLLFSPAIFYPSQQMADYFSV